MGPQVRYFLLLNALALAAVVLFMLWRKPKSATRFRFTKGRAANGEAVTQPPAARSRVPPLDPFALDDTPPPAREKVLNVFFNYNGHEWDAYEVLGVPAGSSMQRVEAAYQEALGRVEEPSKAFLHSAYQAIRTKLMTGS